MDKSRECLEWLNYANDDLESAEILNKQHRKPLNIICYHCQQAAEKYLKVFLVSRGISFEKTHDLLKIIDNCQIIEEQFDLVTRECLILNPYSIITRYPSELELVESDANSAIKSASKIGEFVKSIINNHI